MSFTNSNKKRKAESESKGKSKSRPSKKFRKTAYQYNSDSEGGQEDEHVTARDAPRGAPASKKATIIEAESVTQHKANQTKPESKPIKSTNEKEKSARKATPVKDVGMSKDSSSEESQTDDGETDELDVDAAGDSDLSGSDSDASMGSRTASSATRTKTKRHDPTAFATSISAILGSSLSRSKRADPVLSRSKDAAEVSKALSEAKLETQARKKLVAERRLAKEKGRVRDVLIGDRNAIAVDEVTGDQATGMSAADNLAKEKALRKLAQRGVIKLFNAVRAAQVRGEEEARKVKKQGVVGISNRESKVKEMSRNAFLDLVGAGGEKR